jgi:hypothetical protein
MEEGGHFKIVQKETWGNKEAVTVHELDGDNWKVVRFIIEKILVCLLLSRRIIIFHSIISFRWSCWDMNWIYTSGNDAW